MNYITRFAPSPTGNLHVGNLRTAIFNYILAKKTSGKFILRLDDTDKDRSTEEFSDQIKRDLEWLGFEWDRCEKQSERISIYDSIAKKLKEGEHLYECFETPEELEFKRRKQLSMGRPPVYDRSSLTLTSAEKVKLRNERQSYWRLKLDRSRVDWQDGILGSVSIDAASVSDPVLIRGDGQFLYTIASVIDDIDFRINNVIRGSDHVTNTATQIQLLTILESPPPSFAHHSLLVGPMGDPLSKRMNNLSLFQLKNMGLEPEALFIFMAGLGGKIQFHPDITIQDAFDVFKLSDFGAAPTKFDLNVLTLFSQKRLTNLPFSEIQKDLTELEIPIHLQFDFWNMAKENIGDRSDLKDLWRLCTDGAEPVILAQDQEFIAVCKGLIPDEPRDHTSWSSWTDAIKSETTRSGKSLFLPLRMALTGKENAPDMKKLFPLFFTLRF